MPYLSCCFGKALPLRWPCSVARCYKPHLFPVTSTITTTSTSVIGSGCPLVFCSGNRSSTLPSRAGGAGHLYGELFLGLRCGASVTPTYSSQFLWPSGSSLTPYGLYGKSFDHHRTDTQSLA